MVTLKQISHDWPRELRCCGCQCDLNGNEHFAKMFVYMAPWLSQRPTYHVLRGYYHHMPTSIQNTHNSIILFIYRKCLG